MSFANYSVFRAFAIFAGVFGIFQSLIWIGFAITGIIAFYCDLSLAGQSQTLGSLLTVTFFRQYFEGTCTMTNMPNIDMTAVRELNLLSPGDFHAWVWVYLILHIFWAISSLTLLTNAREKYVRYINVFLYIWIALTIVISTLDLALGIQFGVDYGTIIHALFLRPYPTLTAADQTLTMAVTVSGIMMVMAFRGWIFWVINVGMAVYLFTQSIVIYDYNQMRRKSGMTNGGFAEDNSGVRRQPIDGYDMGPARRISQEEPRRPYNPPSNYRRPLERINEQPREPIAVVERPVQQQPQHQQDWSSNPQTFTPQPGTSTVRPFETLQRPQSFTEVEEARPDPPKPIPPPPPPKNWNMNTVVRRDAAAAKVAQELNYRNSMNMSNGNTSNGLRTFAAAPASSNEADLPMANYSPPMPRTNPFENRPPLRSVLRSTRYQ
ncbi:uncharacterized protein LOC129723355 isoform X1 [Wyeomyia smithii]|uniref:uncharacterized protein LOC129723355 isoform X1 n=1 Tax=Wyeomyia smithii TaxID=174621 RepID=UPI002467F7FC|nr:uncharacterized protein LOC129723355 isoform X1 [Wyeomyia smithii]